MRLKQITAALAAAAAIGGAAGLRAESPPPFADFTFKSVKPPKAGSKPGTGGKKRITVQVTPEDMARQNPKTGRKAEPKPEGEGEAVAAAAAPAAEGAQALGRYPWFWEQISPDIAQGGPGRLEPALNRIDNPPGGQSGVNAPRLQALQDIARARGAEILRATVGTEVSPALVVAVIAIESAGKADAVSGAGAKGLMQLMPATAERFGVSDALVAAENIQGGVKYLDFLMKHFDRDPMLVLAGYNAGEGAVKTHGGVPPYAETRDYVPKVLAAFKTARGLCLTAPQLLSDGCVFNVDVREVASNDG